MRKKIVCLLLAAIILPNVVSAFACISMYQTFQSFPRALIEAALIDGSGELAILTKVVLPTMKAGIASLGIMLFINSWNDYMWPRLVVNNLDNAPIQIGLKSFVSSDANLWGSLMAATTAASAGVGTVTRTIWQPALATRRACSTLPAISFTGTLSMVCTAIGSLPPIVTLPILTVRLH